MSTIGKLLYSDILLGNPYFQRKLTCVKLASCLGIVLIQVLYKNVINFSPAHFQNWFSWFCARFVYILLGLGWTNAWDKINMQHVLSIVDFINDIQKDLASIIQHIPITQQLDDGYLNTTCTIACLKHSYFAHTRHVAGTKLVWRNVPLTAYILQHDMYITAFNPARVLGSSSSCFTWQTTISPLGCMITWNCTYICVCPPDGPCTWWWFQLWKIVLVPGHFSH